MTNKEIYTQLRKAGMTAEGACAVLGNMAAESGMKPTNVEDRCPLNDEAYTALVDNEPTYDFATDNGAQYGYGYCQWTSADRKRGLLALARANGKSIGDAMLQVGYCVQELVTQYPDLMQRLCSSHDMLQLTQAVCVEYERPAHNNVGTRYEYAQMAFEAFANGGEDHFAEAGKLADDACPIDGPCEQSKPDVSGAFSLLAEYMQTEEFQTAFLAWAAKKGDRHE